MQILRREQREFSPQIEPRLRSENGISACARAVGFELAFVEDESKEVEIFDHAAMLKTLGELSMKLCAFDFRHTL